MLNRLKMAAKLLKLAAVNHLGSWCLARRMESSEFAEELLDSRTKLALKQKTCFPGTKTVTVQ